MANLYFVPKAVVLGDAKSVCTDGILDEGPISHHMITAENTHRNKMQQHLLHTEKTTNSNPFDNPEEGIPKNRPQMCYSEIDRRIAIDISCLSPIKQGLKAANNKS